MGDAPATSERTRTEKELTETPPSPDHQVPGDESNSIFDRLLREEAKNRAVYAALYYASLGLPVFPVKIVEDISGKERKTPCVKDWPNVATTDSVVITRWWSELAPGAMIGIVTGYRSGWGVLDVDCKNGGRGFESLTRLADEIAPLDNNAREIAFGTVSPEDRLKPAGLVRTRSGGLHLWYRLGERSKTRGRNKIRGLPGLEFKATGHYVVAPPSEGYEWIEHLPAEREPGLASSDYLATCPTIPENLLSRLLEGGDDDPFDGDGDELKIIAKGNGPDLLKAAVRTLMTTVEGEGNNTVYRICCDLYPYVALGELSKAEVDRAIWAGIRGWGADEGGISATMASAWKRTGERNLQFNTDAWPAALEPMSSGTSLATLASIASDVVEDEEERPELVVVPDAPDEAVDETETSENLGLNADEIRAMIPSEMLTDPVAMKYIVEEVDRRRKSKVASEIFQAMTSAGRSWTEADLGDDDSDPFPDVLVMGSGQGLLYRGEMNMTWGLASAGKSWLAYLAIMQQVKLKMHAILLDYENGRRRIRSRLRMLGLSPEEIREYVHVYLGETGMVPVKRMPCALDQVGVVVTDSCTGALAAMDLDARSTGDIESFACRNVNPFTEAGAAVLILDHVTHDTDKHDRPINSVHKLNRVQGAGYQVESIVPFTPGESGWSWIRLWKDNSGGVEQIRGENVGRLVIDASDPERLVVMIDTDTTSLAVMSQVNKVDDVRVEKLIAQLNEAGISPGLSVNRTREAMTAAGIRAGQDLVRLAMAQRKVAG